MWYTSAPMPRNPEQGRPKEQQPLPYSLASRFATKQAAETPYIAAQETIHTADCELSAYRFLIPSQQNMPKPWYVAVVGQKPAEAIHQQLTTILSAGELASLPDAVTQELLQRRAEITQHGPWVERHYTHTLKKKDKRKQQDKSRRRNRGK